MRAASLVVAAALAGTVACTGTCNKTHEVSEKIGKRVLSVEAENELGEQLAAQLRSQVRLLDDRAVQQRLAALGTRLVAAADHVPEGMQIRFAVIDAPDVVNAIAMPGGYIYVFSGLLRSATDAELAGVLAHEIGHVVERHVSAQLVTAYGIETLRDFILGSNRSQIGEVITGLLSRGALGAFSRTAEREADDLAIRMLVRAGEDPRGYVSFFEKLAKAERGGRLGRFLASHPDPKQRADRARKQIASLEARASK